MIYETGTVIIAAPSVESAREAILKYGVYDVDYPADPDVTVIPTIFFVTTYAEAMATLTDLPSNTPWASVETIPPSLKTYMEARFGGASLMPVVIKALNDQYAISPKRLMR